MLILLVALWVFSFWATSTEGYNLLQTSKIDNTAGRPTKTLITTLQSERRASLVYLGGRKHGLSAGDLRQQRAHTDQVIAQWRRTAKEAPGGKIRRAVAATSAQLTNLPSLRAAINSGTITRDAAAKGFNTAIDAGFQIVSVNAELDDPDISADGRALIALTRAREMLSREDAFLAGVLADGRFGTGEYVKFAQTVALRGQAEQDAAAQLPDADRRRLQELQRGTAYSALQRLEQQAQQPRRQGRTAVTPVQWQAATQPVLTAMDRAVDIGGNEVVDQGTVLGYQVLAKWAGVGVLGGAALIAAIVTGVGATRKLDRGLKRLLMAVQEAEAELPGQLRLIGEGKHAGVRPIEFGADEIGEIGRTFNRLVAQVVEATQAEAATRASSRRIIRDLGDRTYSLMTQLLDLVTAMEKRRDINPEELQQLFRLDALVVRALKNARNIGYIGEKRALRSGGTRPVSLYELLRDAIGQTHAYERVKLGTYQDYGLVGYAFEDVVTIIAELIDNALMFSDKVVEVETTQVAHGVAVVVQDRGYGFSDEDIARHNEFFATAPEVWDSALSPEGKVRIGFYIIAQRARAHGIKVTVQSNAYRGADAVVLLPTNLITDPPPSHAAKISTAAPQVAVTAGGGSSAPAAAVGLLEAPSERTLRPVPDAGGPVTADVADAGAGDVAPAVPDAPDTVPSAEATTPGGLPVRDPGRSLAPELQEETSPADDEPDPLEGRSPEQVRTVMTAFQSGTRRGRTEAARHASEEDSADE
ncbi:sensor histidine kinase [Actinomadura napierensis]|uniref:histidine kinase n=1 Tax=Actinomadura napierensis TaxID=267854 RepID=A0ABN3AFE3_9ACTN